MSEITGDRHHYCAAASGTGFRQNSPFVYVYVAILAIVLLVMAPSAHLHADQNDPIPALAVKEIAPGIFASQGRLEIFSPANCGQISNSGFIIGSDAVAVIDTGGSLRAGMALRAAIRARTKLPIRYVINTHMHPDHVFGNAAFIDDDAKFVGHKRLLRSIQARREQYLQANEKLLGKECFAGTQILPPTLLVDQDLDLDLGGRVLHLNAYATAHTDNDLTVLDDQTGTLWLGDLLFVDHVPALDGSIKGWLAAMEKLKSLDVKRVVPGHGPVSVALPQAILPQEKYLSRLATDLRELIAQGGSLADAGHAAVNTPDQSIWRLFKEFHARNVTTAYSELEWE